MDLENRLNAIILAYSDKVVDRVIKAQDETADMFQQEIKAFAPERTGQYKESIKRTETNYDGDIIKTKIFTDASVMTVNGVVYNLGQILEHGTEPHAIPNAWGKGYTFGHIGADGKFHKGTMDPDWHPGTKPQPHFALVLQKDGGLYFENIRKAVRGK